MQHDFWHERWATRRLGFHQEKVNSRLRKFWRAAAAADGETVFVPLCGKSLDMLWLRDAGHCVIGIEISETACHDFFRENDLREKIVADGDSRFIKMQSENITLLCGDFFALTEKDLCGAKLIYDRAALIALPEKMRADYAAKLAQLSPPGARVFLIGMDYDQSKMKGPPFSVEESEVRSLFQQYFRVEIVTQSSGPDIVGNLAARGLDTLNEKVYLLRRNET